MISGGKCCYNCRYCVDDGEYWCEMYDEFIRFTFLLNWYCKRWEAKTDEYRA